MDGNHHQLEGSVTLSVSRYLHLSTDLWLSEWLPTTSDASSYGISPSATTSTTEAVAPQGITVPTRPRAAIAKRDASLTGDEPVGLGSASAPNDGFGYSASSGYSTASDSAVFHGENALEEPAVMAPAEKIAARVAVLNEERRLRSGELHYIDHPKLGVLIEVRTVEQTEESEEQEEAVEFGP